MTNITEKITAKAEIKGELVEQFVLVKEFFGLENNAELIRVLIKEKARSIQREQLNKDSGTKSKIDELFYLGYFDEFLEELKEKEPVLFQRYIESVKPREKESVKS